MFKTFEVEVLRTVDPSSLEWPEPGKASTDYGLGGNRQYVDLRRFSWIVVKRTIKHELSLMNELKSSKCAPEDYEDEEFEQVNESLFGLDVGVASTVMALSASRCIPFTSCNAGAFSEGGHHESYPVVAFYTKPAWVSVLVSAAQTAGIGLTNDGGAIVAFADDIYKFPQFSRVLYRQRREINGLKLTHRVQLSESAAQLRLFPTY